MNYLIDTNVISEVRKGANCDARVAAWYDTLADENVYLSVLVVGEIRKGIERARAREPARARALEIWLSTLTRSYADRILPINQAVAEEWGRMSAGRPVSTVDALLAATVKVHGMTLATRNITDVADLGVRVVNPFDA